jgi:2-oxoglutarate ferredoxin oxidoreductase subunit beta
MSDMKYLRNNKLPHIWCPGCGNGIVLGAIERALEKANVDKDKTIIVSGIGCSSRMPTYMDFNTLHTTHGRALAFATGIKLANPELTVFVIMGDGDASAIGGNHFIHAARRNIGLNAIIVNNNIYGMTGGQYSPMTPTGMKATTAPYGMVERNFDLCELAHAAGATYVARGTVYHAKPLTDLILESMDNDGFSVVEVLSTCPVGFGRRNKIRGNYKLMEWVKDRTLNVKAAAKMSEEEKQGKLLIGKLYSEPAEEYTKSYDKIIEIAKQEAKR